MKQSNVLVVDDEKEIADFIELYLKNEIMRCSSTTAVPGHWNV